MEPFLTLIPNSLVAWLALLLGIIFLVLYFIRREKSDTVQNLQESNATLRGLIGDQDKKIASMQEALTLVINKTNDQEVEIELLKKDRETFAGLIRSALTEYFQSHPEKAVDLQVAVSVAASHH